MSSLRHIADYVTPNGTASRYSYLLDGEEVHAVVAREAVGSWWTVTDASTGIRDSALCYTRDRAMAELAAIVADAAA